MESFPFDIRYSDIEKDGETLRKWLSDPNDSKWYPMQTKAEIEAGAKNWIGFSKYKASLTATHKNQPVGIGTLFLMPYKKVAHQTMFYLIVGKSYRRKGIGFSLVQNLMNLAHKYFSLESIQCEVYGGCSLIPILEKLHFSTYARQENYVKDHDKYLPRILMEYFF